MEVTAHVSLKIALKDPLRNENSEKLAYLKLVLKKKKRNNATKRNLIASEKFKTLKPCSNIFFLEMSRVLY